VFNHFLDQLPARLEAALASTERGYLTSVTLDVPMPDFPTPVELPDESIFWSRPAQGHFRLAVGRALRLAFAGVDRFEQLDQRLRELESDWSRGDDVPGVFLGFAFSPVQEVQRDWAPLANTLALVPRVVIDRGPLGCRLTFSCRADEDRDDVMAHWLDGAGAIVRAFDPDTVIANSAPIVLREIPGAEADWLARVRRALDEIRSGKLDKLVLTRRITMLTSRPLRPGAVLAWLGDRYNDCTLFSFRESDMALVGVSPERLLSIRDGAVLADALAGSAPRLTPPEEDRIAGEMLLKEIKAQHEHAVVVDDIIGALRPDCVSVSACQAPSLLKLPTVQHLWSQVHGQLREGVRPLALISRLHPTPAVGGMPREQALTWLQDHGETRWGWYTGGVGWLDGNGAEVSVVLRCGLLNGATADLFAGAGIVAGSVPETELDETRWKLDALREALAIG
jgi:isochorismate synthase